MFCPRPILPPLVAAWAPPPLLVGTVATTRKRLCDALRDSLLSPPSVYPVLAVELPVDAGRIEVMGLSNRASSLFMHQFYQFCPSICRLFNCRVNRIPFRDWNCTYFDAYLWRKHSFNEIEYLSGIETTVIPIYSTFPNCFNEPEYLLGIET